MNLRRFNSVLAALLCMLPMTAALAQHDVQVSTVSIPAGGGTVRATVFEQAGKARRPVVVVLHGAGGMIFDGPEMRRISRHLAEDGNAVYLLHYFNRTGTVAALDSTMQRHFGLWRRTVVDAIAEIQARRGDASPVGIYGYSLGGFLALFSASDNPRVGAVVEHAGGVWNAKLERIRKMPPVLMIHGEQDARVPFTKYATPLVPVLRARARTVETRFFPAEAHAFTPAAMMTVREDAARFFRKWLRR